jgi:hypothetical protein
VSDAAPAPGLDRETLERAFASFAGFCGLLKVTGINDGLRMPMRLTGIQRAYNASRTTRDIILKPRRVYMTTLEVARDLWWFLTKRGARVIIVCQSADDHGTRDEIADMLRTMLESLREHFPIKLDIENNLRLAWYERDSRLRIVEAGATLDTARTRGRGITVNRLHATEFAAWRHGVETLTVLLNAMPQDPKQGEVVIESTPRGATGPYHERWQDAVSGKGNFTAQFFPWYHHEAYRAPLDPDERLSPENEEEQRLFVLGVSPEAIKWRRKQIADQGADVIAQEYPSDPETCFLLSGREFFDSKVTIALLANAKPPEKTYPLRGSGVHATLRVWGKPERGVQYCIGADTSMGGGGDDSGATVREFGTGVEVAKISGQIKPGEFAGILAKLGVTYNVAVIAVERNGESGGATIDRLVNVIRYPRVFHDRDKKPGWLTSTMSRPAALAALEQGHRDGTWRTLDKPTLQQMKVFVWRDKPNGQAKAEAAPNEKDDLIMCEAVCWDVLRRPIAKVTRDLDIFEEASY